MIPIVKLDPVEKMPIVKLDQYKHPGFYLDMDPDAIKKFDYRRELREKLHRFVVEEVARMESLGAVNVRVEFEGPDTGHLQTKLVVRGALPKGREPVIPSLDGEENHIGAPNPTQR